MTKNKLQTKIDRYGKQRLADDSGYSLAMIDAVYYGRKSFGGAGTRKVIGLLGMCPCCHSSVKG